MITRKAAKVNKKERKVFFLLLFVRLNIFFFLQ